MPKSPSILFISVFFYISVYEVVVIVTPVPEPLNAANMALSIAN